MQNRHPLAAALRRPTVLLADDHPLILDSLQKLLEPDLEVVERVRDGLDLVESAKRLRPDLVITDISMPGINGIEATRQLRAAAPGVRVLILSIHTGASWMRAAFAAGACGYLLKTAAPEEIEAAVYEVLVAGFHVNPRVARAVFQPAEETDALFWPERLPSAAHAGNAASEPLTRRELEILPLVAQGMGNKAIAEWLGVSVTTVRTHLSSVYGKLRLDSRVELALFAAQAAGAVM